MWALLAECLILSQCSATGHILLVSVTVKVFKEALTPLSDDGGCGPSTSSAPRGDPWHRDTDVVLIYSNADVVPALWQFPSEAGRQAGRVSRRLSLVGCSEER